MFKKKIIVVDLDGTLINTDSLYESLLKGFYKHPIRLITMVPCVSSKSLFKQKVSSIVELDPAALPYNHMLIKWLNERKESGSYIVLATGADIKIANPIAKHLNLFDEVIASDGKSNMTGINKCEELCRRFGTHNFTYVGNSKTDLAVWKKANKAVVVNARNSVLSAAKKLTSVEKVISPSKKTFDSWRRVFRFHQYLKNLLVFVPFLAAQKFTDLSSLFSLAYGFLAFCLCASSVYITNDLIDLESDRKHPRKRFRPFASGNVPILYGVVLAPICLAISFMLAFMVNKLFIFWLAGYYILTTLYSLKLKQLILLDCLTLAALYTLRIIAGGAASSTPLSFWLLAFSIFLFLSLAYVKRYAELHMHLDKGSNTNLVGRGYNVEDEKIIQMFGISAGYTAVLILALYLNSDQVLHLYQTPQIIWFSIPIMLFWISWLWMKAHRGEMHDDPVVFAVKDKVSLLAGLAFIVTFIMAKLIVL